MVNNKRMAEEKVFINHISCDCRRFAADKKRALLVLQTFVITISTSYIDVKGLRLPQRLTAARRSTYRSLWCRDTSPAPTEAPSKDDETRGSRSSQSASHCNMSCIWTKLWWRAGRLCPCQSGRTSCRRQATKPRCTWMPLGGLSSGVRSTLLKKSETGITKTHSHNYKSFINIQNPSGI